MTTTDKGEIAKLKIELRAAEKGLLLSLPTRAESRYDCIIDDGKQLLRAQIKFASCKDKRTEGIVYVGLRHKRKHRTTRYSSEEIDIVLAYLPDIDKVLAFPKEKFENKSGITVRIQPRKNGERGEIYYEDFLW